MKVEELIDRELVTLRRDDSVEALLRALDEVSQDVFPVLDPDGRVVGTVSELDLIRVLSPNRQTFAWGPRKLAREGLVQDVEDVMTPRPSSARPDESLDVAVKRMGDLLLSELVVVDGNGMLLGLLRARDVFLAMRGAPR